MKTRLKLKVVPGSSRNEVMGWHGAELKLKVQAPPESGKANQAARELLAQVLNLNVSHLQLISGLKNRSKVVEIDGLSDAEVSAAIAASLAQRS